MAESVVSSIAERLGNLLIQEANVLHGVRGQVEHMQTELELMRSFLEEADRRQDEDKRVDAWISEIREAAYDAADVIETFALKVASRKRGGIQNAIRRYACIISEAIETHKVGSEIEAIKTRISNLRTSLQNYGIMPKSEGEGSSSMHRTRRNLRRTCLTKRTLRRQVYSHVVEEYTVGLDEDVKTLVAQLVNEEKSCGVVSICGMGGLGKTTLAKKVYHHRDIRHHFDGFAWASISQQFQPRYVWEGILFELISPSKKQREEIEGMRDEEVARKLHQVQLQKKCIVILDDIWRTNAWDNLSAAFPVGQANSKIMLTTRNKEVAGHVDSRGFLHEPPYLNEKESWDLLQTKAFPEKDDPDFRVDTGKEKLGMEMVRRSKGLPLAIVVLGGILATKYTLNEWMKVHGNIKRHLIRGKGNDQQLFGVYEVLALSYHELPYHLKLCFLHLGHFPEDSNIPTKKLFRIWVAEGIVSPAQYEVDEEEPLEEIAERYLVELIQRSMVQVGVRGSTGTIKTCRLHDLMRDFCLLKVNQENYLKIVHLPDQNMQVDSLSSMATTARSTRRVRRLAIYLNEKYWQFFPEQIMTHYLQSLLFFNPHELGTIISQRMKFKFSNFKLLRVLDFEKCAISGKLPRAIGSLLHLRYLSLNCLQITSIPSSIANLRFLQTLILKSASINQIWVPNVIWKMEQLRHLCLDINIRSTKGMLQLGNLSNLQTLQGFQIDSFDVKGLMKLTNLKKLEISECNSLNEFEGVLISSNAMLNRLCSLTIRFKFTDEATDLQQLFLGCHHLHKLFVAGWISYFPESNQFPPNLTKLILWDSYLEEDPMATLEKLPHLVILHLKSKAFIGNEMVCSSNGFPQLKSLVLGSLPHLEEWSVSEGAMPSLCKLVIDSCSKLEMIPDGLRFITTLQELEFVAMPQAFREKPQVVQHVPSVIFKEY